MQHVLPDISTTLLSVNSSESSASASAFTFNMMFKISFSQLTWLLVAATSLASSATTSRTKAEVALNTLQQWYNETSGIWDTTGWWNGANCLTALGDLAAIDSSAVPTAQSVFTNTFVQAQKLNLQELKVITPDFNILCLYDDTPLGMNPAPVINPKGFLNGFYDDEGWWALAWIQAYDVTKNPAYLETAMDIFTDMRNGSTTPCGGGIWWDKAHTYVNAIANELYLSVGAHLANRVSNNRSFYLNTAVTQYNWFHGSGMINSKHLINDGLTPSCQNNNQTVWSYNQGVILGGLVELATATGNTTYLSTASTLANAAISALTDSNDILHDPCEPNCGADGSQFKGVFMRNLQKLQGTAPSQRFVNFFAANAASIWAYDRSRNDNELSVQWSGPFVAPANASTQSSALDALIADQACGSSSGVIASRRRVKSRQ